MTVNGVQLFTVGSKTVSVPDATTTATGAPCACQPKLAPGITLYDSSSVVPDWAWIVVAWIFPTAICFATIGVPVPNDGAAVASAQRSASPSSLTFMVSSCPSVGSAARRGR
ncbi:MAG TPA: hypothetical protein VIU86_16865 [Gaiellaceae bacterium]